MDRRDTTSIDGTPLPPPAPRGTPAIRLDLVRSVRLHPLLAATVAAVTFALIAGYAITRKPSYKAEALDYVEPITAKVLSDGSDGLFDATRYESYLQQQIQTIQRPDILQAAVESLPIGYWHFPGESTANAASRLGNSLKVERQGTSFQVSLSLMGPDPVGTAAAVNAVNMAYLQKGRKDETTRTDGRVQLLQEERDRLTTELQSDRTEQVALGSTLGVANPVGPTADAYDTDLSNIRAELVAARQAHDVAAAQLASVTGPNGSTGMAAIATENTAGDPGLQALKTSFSQRRAALTTQMAGLTPGNPIYKQDQAELAQLDQQLAFRASLAQSTSSQQLRDRLSLDLKRTGDVEARLNGQLANATARATSAAPKLQRATELAADIDRLQARYAAVDNALRGLQLEANGPGVVHLSVPATAPLAPEPSRRNLLRIASVPLALLFGAIAAMFARRRAGRVYTENDLEPILGFTPIGAMPYAASLSSGNSGAGESSEDLLRLAAGLERAHRRTGVKTFVFTAASPSTEIAGFVAAMARELERLGFRTRTQSTSGLLRSWDAPSSESEILVAGIRQGIGARLDALKQRTDFVLLDAPPLLHSAETEYFLSAADVTVLLIESGVTTERELVPAMDLLRKLRVGGLAAVLLNVPADSSAYSRTPARSFDRLPQADTRIAPRVYADAQPERAPQPQATRSDAAAAMHFVHEPETRPEAAGTRAFKTETNADFAAEPAPTPKAERTPAFFAELAPRATAAAPPAMPAAPVTPAAPPVMSAAPAMAAVTPMTAAPTPAAVIAQIQSEVPTVMKTPAVSDPNPDFDPEPPPPSPSKIRRIFSLFHHDREPVNPFSFVPPTYDGSDPEPAYAAPAAYATPAAQTEPAQTGPAQTGPAQTEPAQAAPAIQADPVNQADLINLARPTNEAGSLNESRAPRPASRTWVPTAASASSTAGPATMSAPQVDKSSRSPVQVAIPQANTIVFNESAAPAPAERTATTPAPSMLVWEARIPHRAPVAEEVAVPAATAFAKYTQQTQSQSASDATRMSWTPSEGFRPEGPRPDGSRPSAPLEPVGTVALPLAPSAQVTASAESALPPVLAEPISELEPLVLAPAAAATSAYPTTAAATGITLPASMPQPAVASALGAPGDRSLPLIDEVPQPAIVEPSPSLIESLIAAKTAHSTDAPTEPRQLPSSAERLAFRAANPTPRRPSLSSIPVAQAPINPGAPRPEPGTRVSTAPSASPTATQAIASAPRPVSGTRPISKTLSAEQVAERIVETSGITRRNNAANRPHIMPPPPVAQAGRRWAMLSRFSKDDAAPEAEPMRPPAPRDRAAG